MFGSSWLDAPLAADGFSLALPSGVLQLRHWDELGELPEVLGGGGEVELVPGTTRAA